MTLHIVAQNIKNGGGRELLIYLIDYLSKNYQNLKVIVYLDASLSDIRDEKKTKNIRFLLFDSAVSKIRLYSMKLDNALYFGNIPPLRKAHNTMVYFHNPYLLLRVRDLLKYPFTFCCKYILQQLYIKTFIWNVGSVACQSPMIKQAFQEKYNFHFVELLPFFRLCANQTNASVKKYDLCYISLAHPHKNHNLLLDALEVLARKGVAVRVAVTIEDDKLELIDKLESINNNCHNIIEIDNLGVISKNEVCNLYAESRCLIFPSTKETFGLGLIEAAHMGLDIIAPDLEYVCQVVRPSLVFNPKSVTSCANAIQEYLLGKRGQPAEGLIENKIDTLVSKFIKE